LKEEDISDKDSSISKAKDSSFYDFESDDES